MSDNIEKQTFMIHCRFCNKTHAVTLSEQECAPGAWVEEVTGLTFAALQRLRTKESATVVKLDNHAPLPSVGLVCVCGKAISSIEGVARACECGRVWIISVIQISGPR